MMRSQDSLLVQSVKSTSASVVSTPSSRCAQQQEQIITKHHQQQRQNQRKSPLLFSSSSTTLLTAIDMGSSNNLTNAINTTSTTIGGGGGGIMLGENKSATIGSPIRHSSDNLTNSQKINNNNNNMKTKNHNDDEHYHQSQQHNRIATNSLQQQHPSWTKLQILEQRKIELEKLLNEKKWLLQQVYKQENQVLTGNYENFNFNFNEIYNELVQQNNNNNKNKTEYNGIENNINNNGNSNSILHFKGGNNFKSTDLMMISKEKLPSSSLSNRQLSSSLSSNFPNSANDHQTAGFSATLNVQQKHKSPQQLTTSQNVMILKKRQVPTISTKTTTTPTIDYRDNCTKSPSLTTMEYQQKLYQKYHHHQKNPSKFQSIQPDKYCDADTLSLCGKSINGSRGGGGGGGGGGRERSEHYLHSTRENQNQQIHNLYYTRHNSSSAMPSDKYYLSPTNQTYGEGFIKSSQNIKKYMPPLKSPAVVLLANDAAATAFAANTLRCQNSNLIQSESQKTGLGNHNNNNNNNNNNKDHPSMLLSKSANLQHHISKASLPVASRTSPIKIIGFDGNADSISLVPSTESTNNETTSMSVINGIGTLLSSISNSNNNNNNNNNNHNGNNNNNGAGLEEIKNCCVVKTSSLPSNQSKNLYNSSCGINQQHLSSSTSISQQQLSPGISSSSSAGSNMYIRYSNSFYGTSAQASSPMSNFNSQCEGGSGGKASDEISISSINSEIQKKQPRKKQWIESSLDGPVIRSNSMLSPMPDIVLDSPILSTSSSRLQQYNHNISSNSNSNTLTLVPSSHQQISSLSPSMPSSFQQFLIQSTTQSPTVTTTTVVTAASSNFANSNQRSIVWPTAHLTNNKCATTSNATSNYRSKLSSQSMSGGSYRMQKASKLCDDKDYLHLSQSTSYLNMMDPTAPISGGSFGPVGPYHNHHHYQHQQNHHYHNQSHQVVAAQHLMQQQHRSEQQYQHQQQQQQLLHLNNQSHNMENYYDNIASSEIANPTTFQSLLKITSCASNMIACSSQATSALSLPLLRVSSTPLPPHQTSSSDCMLTMGTILPLGSTTPTTTTTTTTTPTTTGTTPVSPDIRIESPKNITVIQEATFLPYKEVTKPFEMSDFYKYSTKFRHKDNSATKEQITTTIASATAPTTTTTTTAIDNQIETISFVNNVSSLLPPDTRPSHEICQHHHHHNHFHQKHQQHHRYNFHQQAPTPAQTNM